MSFTFRRAETNDLEAVKSMYAAVTCHAGEVGDPARWHMFNHPGAEEIEKAVLAGELYVAEETGPAANVIVGGVVLNQEGAEGYDRVPWPSGAHLDEVVVLHLLGVHPDRQGRGVAKFLLGQAGRLGREQGLRALRLETFPTNYPARVLYERVGFTDLGEHILNFGQIGSMGVQVLEQKL